MAATLEEIALGAAERALDKQEALLHELRARTGVLLAAASLAASYLGGRAFIDPEPAWLVFLALAAFVVTVGSSVYALTPKPSFAFALSGTRLYERFFGLGDDMAEVQRRLAYDLQRIWDRNDALIRSIIRAYRFGATALMVEMAALAALVTGTIAG